MANDWPLVPLSEVLTERQEIPASASLESGTIRIVSKIGFNDGQIQLRNGGETKTGMILIHPGDLVLSGINAIKGAIAIYDKAATSLIAATIHYSAYIPNNERVDVRFLWWLLRSETFREILLRYLPGGIKSELKAKRLLPVPVPLPPLAEQQRLVARIEGLARRVAEARGLRREAEKEIHQMLLGAYNQIVEKAPSLPMSEVAPLCRRRVKVDLSKEHLELGVRSFGKGTFHKPAISGASLGTKRIFQIEPGDLVFNNVFAWEGAVAVAEPEDRGRVGSHRFITCVPKPHLATSSFLCFHFLTEDGLEQLGEASPGGAGRNRTLGLEALANIQVPAPALDKQIWFDGLQAKVDELRRLQAETQRELDALMPSVLARAFAGEL